MLVSPVFLYLSSVCKDTHSSGLMFQVFVYLAVGGLQSDRNLRSQYVKGFVGYLYTLINYSG